jgi:hypothetical protein
MWRAALLLFIASVSCYAWLHRFAPASAQQPAKSEECFDYNVSCATPCPTCMRMSRSACARCDRGSGPACSAGNHTTTQMRQAIRWLHFPKCGSTLAVSIVAYACSDSVPAWHAAGMALKGGRIDVRMAHAVGARGRTRGARCEGRLLLPFDGHRPVSARDTHLVAMFRRPSQRLISAYLDNYHAWGLARKERAQLKALAPTVSSFARYPGVAGCYAKMLAGHQCAERIDLSDGTVLQRALEVLQSGRFAFIGLVEEWASSICLFHRTLPGSARPMIAEFRHLGHSVNSHRDIPWLPTSQVDGKYNESVLEGFVDAVDERVYEEAAAIFRRNLRVALTQTRR